MNKITNTLSVLKRLLALYGKKFKRKFLVCYILSLLVGLVEAASLGSLVPLLNSMLNVDSGFNLPPFIKEIVPLWVDRENFIIAICLLTLSMFIIKSLISSFTYLYFSRVAYEVKRYTSFNLAKYYVMRPFHLSLLQNSSELQRNLTLESNEMLSRVFLPLMHISVETVVLLFLTTFLFLLDPVVSTVVLLLFVSVTFLFLSFSSRRSIAWGKRRQEADNDRLRLGNEMLLNIAELKMSGKENVFLHEFDKSLQTSAHFESNQYFMGLVPKIILEVAAILFFCGSVISLVLIGYSTNEVTLTLAIFAAAAFRIMPSFNKIISSINNLSFGKKVIDVVSTNFEKLENLNIIEASKKIDFKQAIVLKKVKFSYNDRENYNLTIDELVLRKNSYTGIVGESGSGKSTLLSLITGLLTPNEGILELDGVTLSKQSLMEWQKGIGYVHQKPYFIDNTIAHNVALELDDDKIDLDHVKVCLEKVGLLSWAEDLPNGLWNKIGENAQTLSGGQRQRLAIARALYKKPYILVFDEALAALDKKNRLRLNEFIDTLKGSTTIISVTHNLEELANADSVYEISKGALSQKK